jgi:Tfp pilus assembly protein PilE
MTVVVVVVVVAVVVVAAAVIFTGIIHYLYTSKRNEARTWLNTI